MLNNMAQWRDVHGEQFWAQLRTLRYTMLQHCRLGCPASNQHWLRSVKYDSSHRSTTPDMPKVSLSLFSSILWSSVLNAADRSRSTEWKQILDHRPWAGHLWLLTTRFQCYGLLCMLTEMSQVCQWHSDGQTAVEGQPFRNSLKGSVGWKQGDSS